MTEILAATAFPKSTYMYWQARLDRVDADKEIKDEILKIRKMHKDYGYRRVHAQLRKLGIKLKRPDSEFFRNLRIKCSLSIVIPNFSSAPV